MKLKNNKALVLLLLVLVFFVYPYLSGIGAFSGRLDIFLALKKSDAGWIYLDEPLASNGTLVNAATSQYSYSAYSQQGSTDVIVTDQSHRVVSVIVFEDINKGTLGITTSGEQAHIHLRSGRVAILNGGDVVEVQFYQEASSKGIHYRPEIVVAEPWEAVLFISMAVLLVLLFLHAFIRSYKEDR